jgi:hypothetical protein
MGVAERVRVRTKLEICESPGGNWVVRDAEPEAAHVLGIGELELYDGARSRDSGDIHEWR